LATTPADIALHKLPVQLRMLVRLAGYAGAFALAQKLGGTFFTCPKHLHSARGRDLVELVGADGAGALVAELGGQTLQLPKYDSVMRQLRHQRVVALREQAAKHHEIALATGYTVRQVINILNAGLPEKMGCGAEAGLQGDLFGAGAADTPSKAPVGPKVPTAHNPFGLQAVAPGHEGPTGLTKAV
jgi:hypothetical protein